MQNPGDLIGQLRAAGAEHVQEAAPDVVDLDVLRGWCEREERILRLQYEDGRLPQPYESEVASYPLTNVQNAMRRWALIKHVYRLRSEQLEPVRDVRGNVEETVRKILRREPVVVHLLGRAVKVTSRSYGAMAEIYRASLAIDQLDADIRMVAGREVLLRAERRKLSPLQFARRNALRRRIADVRALAVRLQTEQRWHRMAIYAHALTDSGAPARDVMSEAPEWWEEMGPAEDAALLEALWQAGPGRYKALGRAPENRNALRAARGATVTLAENFGFGSLFTLWEPKMGLEPAELYDRDLVQVLVQLRAQATVTESRD